MSLYPVNFPGTIRLYFLPEFRRWYEPIPERSDLFRRRQEPLSDQALRRFFGGTLAAEVPSQARSDDILPLELALRNTGELPWHHKTQRGVGVVNIIAEWRDANGKLVDLAHPTEATGAARGNSPHPPRCRHSSAAGALHTDDRS